ncbi:hypothetical protein NET02_07235 [Thermomicrobiaceae bacterium CFH 74404]|uniref:NurA domain-containing protein n=1 Tax=Thermalbibacter longus TaxID=2951981 RepID=A0AA41WEJ6_9BACT|nr:hypothetical protein [Thermalbibacter longus]MCM8748930.1 hypothetical protein [Thermalbibacter longus]
MIDSESRQRLRQEIIERMASDRALLDSLRDEIRPLVNQMRRIQPRSTTAVSLVATDGGNIHLRFDPFLVQLVRVVDSSNNEYCLEVVTPTTDVRALARRQFDENGAPVTALGRLMHYLGQSELYELSPMIPRSTSDGHPVSRVWIQVYRELVEWAILFTLVREYHFATDTLIVFDGLLRSKIFSRDLFARVRQGLWEGIQEQFRRHHRRIYLVGLAKHSKVLDRYRLAMALEGVLTCPYPAYVEVPREIEEKAYVWTEYARGDDRDVTGEINKYVAGNMFLVKFGPGPRDPIWPVDIFSQQRSEAQTILGCLLADAIEGFPIPYYPRCLQRAHENAALVDFDLDILQDEVFEGIRQALECEAPVLDIFRLQTVDPATRRY